MKQFELKIIVEKKSRGELDDEFLKLALKVGLDHVRTILENNNRIEMQNFFRDENFKLTVTEE